MSKIHNLLVPLKYVKLVLIPHNFADYKNYLFTVNQGDLMGNELIG